MIPRVGGASRKACTASLSLVVATAALLVSPVARADAPDNWKFSLDGYYRTRGYVFGDLYEGQAKPGTYMQQRLRLQPTLNFEDRAKLSLMIDGMDDVVWGDNASLASTALFAGDPSLTGIDGQEVAPIKLKRAWMEFKVPIGLLRVGRQASQWGMGLLANDGNGFDDLFGENHYGSTYDRVIFATRPISIASTIAGKRDRQIPLIAAIGVDRLVEDPLIQYYGTSCGVDNPNDGCDPTEDHGYTEERDEDRRTDTWWVDTNDDVWEMIYVLTYKGEGVHLGKKLVGDVTGGVYVVNRKQGETDSNVLIVDGYAKTAIKGVLFEGELLHIGGDTRAITLQSNDPDDPLYKQADIWGYVVRGGYQNEQFTALLEHGYASGDDSVTDPNFTGRPLHPDFNVGLLLYEEVLARVTATSWGEDAKGLWSNGGVYNSRYIYPNVRVRPLKGWEIDAAGLVAWPDQRDGARMRKACASDDPAQCGPTDATSSYIGWEGDLAVKNKFHDHVNFTLEGGFAHVTDMIPLKSTGLAYTVDDNGREVGNFWTVQSRIAYEF
jgi:hypothetical protein